MDPITMTLMIMGIVALGVLIIVLLYSLSLIRRTNIVMKKADYLIEDLTYKSESLSIGVEAVQRVSNYILSLDAITKKGLKSLTTLLTQNKNFLYSLLEKLRVESADDNKKKPAKKTTKKIAKKSTKK